MFFNTSFGKKEDSPNLVLDTEELSMQSFVSQGKNLVLDALLEAQDKREEKDLSEIEKAIEKTRKQKKVKEKDNENKKGKADAPKKKDDSEKKPLNGKTGDIEAFYERHTWLYKDFMSSYLQDNTTRLHSDYQYMENRDDKRFDWSSGDEIISYKERREVVRVMQMNALMQGQHNHVDPDLKQLYEFWKYASKANLSMSFLMYEKVLSCC